MTRPSALTASTGWAHRAWQPVTWLIALVLCIPLITVLRALVMPAADDGNWHHMVATVLPDYTINTGLLMVMVGAGSAVIGVATAWLCTTCEFPGRRWLSWSLILPLAAPAYVIAYVYTDLLEFAGPVQTGIRHWLELLLETPQETAVLPPIRSLPGAGVMLTLVLYPYVYLLCRAVFQTQSANLFAAARVLGASPWRAFARVALPAARPAVAGGVALVLMETVADYGVVEFFGIPTFTTGMFRAWFALGDQTAALKLAGWLFSIVALLVLLERFARRGASSNPSTIGQRAPRMLLAGWRAAAATSACLLPPLLGFAVPVVMLGHHAIRVGDPLLGTAFIGFFANTVQVAGLAALIATGLAIWLVYAERLSGTRGLLLGTRLATLGYALPGAMVALGILAAVTALDVSLARTARDQFGWDTGLLLTGTTAALVFGYVVRFLTVSYNACQSGLAKIHPRLDEVARTLGAGPGRVLFAVHIPLMRPAVQSALLLCFIDVVKELPATLLLRPFDFETLATRVYRLAADERLAEASSAALCIVVLGLIPTVLLARAQRDRPNADGAIAAG